MKGRPARGARGLPATRSIVLGLCLPAVLLAGAATPAVAGRPEPAVMPDVAYAPGDPSPARNLSVFFPEERAGAPVLVFFHGGGWRSGDKSSLEDFARRLSAEGVIVALPNYRLAPAHKHPSQIDDAAAAALWVSERIPAWGADASCLFAGGHSAGGHLAALLATDRGTPRTDPPSRAALAGVVAVSGVFRIAPQEGGATPAFISSVFGTDETVWEMASPAHHVAARGRGETLPPFALIRSAGEHPLAVRESVEFERLLRETGHEVLALEHPGAGHDSGMDLVTASLLADLSGGRCRAPQVPAPGASPAATARPECSGERTSAREARAVVRGIIAADNREDLDAVLAFYAPDAVLMPPGEAPVQGIEAIRPRYRRLFAAFRPEIASTIDEACAAGGIAFVRGRNGGRLVSRDTGEARTLDDAYLMLLRRDAEGAWRISHLMWHAASSPGAHASGR